MINNDVIAGLSRNALNRDMRNFDLFKSVVEDTYVRPDINAHELADAVEDYQQCRDSWFGGAENLGDIICSSETEA